MKIFSYDPQTGKRSGILRESKVASWTNQSLKFQTDGGFYKSPEAPLARPYFGKDTTATIHVDAGCDASYLDDHLWVCFCLGKFTPGDIWQWVVLPSREWLAEHRTDKEFPTEEEIMEGMLAQERKVKLVNLIQMTLNEYKKADNPIEEAELLAELHELTLPE